MRVRQPAQSGYAVRRANISRISGTAYPTWRPDGVQSGGMNPFAAPPERWISPSLNRVRLAGDTIPAGLQGTTAYNVLSTAALRRGIREAAPALRLPPELPDGELLPALERSFTAPDPAVREAARALAGSYGRGLAYLLLALHRAASLPAAGTGTGTAPTATPEASTLRTAIRPDWQERHWRFWSQIESAIAGGGLVAGRFGQEMLPAAQATLAGEGDREPPVRLEMATWPHELALLGAARYAPAGCRTALAFDFGATALKRAVVLYEGEQLMQVASFPPRPSPCGANPHDGMFVEQPAEQLQQMARLMAATWHAAREAGFQKMMRTIFPHRARDCVPSATCRDYAPILLSQFRPLLTPCA